MIILDYINFILIWLLDKDKEKEKKIEPIIFFSLDFMENMMQRTWKGTVNHNIKTVDENTREMRKACGKITILFSFYVLKCS